MGDAWFAEKSIFLYSTFWINTGWPQYNWLSLNYVKRFRITTTSTKVVGGRKKNFNPVYEFLNKHSLVKIQPVVVDKKLFSKSIK